MVPTIPPEIWITTAEFIPSSILRNLYSVSPVFLHLALNDKYSDINLAVTWSPQTAKYLKHLNHHHIAKRVKRLTLCSDWARPDMSLSPFEKIPLWTTPASYLPFDLGRFIDPILRRRSNIKMCNTLMQNTVLNFPNLSSLLIFDGSCPSSHTQPDPVLVNVYTACASNLRSLSLCSHSPNFNIIFPQNASDFTSLEEVKLTLSPRVDCSANAEAASTFFRAIASSLTTLSISFGDTSEEPWRLFQSFPRLRGHPAFPKLTSFSLFHSEPPASPSPILMQFLNEHAETLRHLRLQHVKLSLISPKSLLPVLPHLESLNILDGSSFRQRQELPSPEGLDAARVYVQHSRNTLTSLSLTHCSFSLHDLGMLLDLLWNGLSENTEGLKSLTVTVQVLSPDLLDVLAEKLPQLEKLEVKFTYLRTADVPTDISNSGPTLTQEDIDPFLLEMRKRTYSRWALRSFSFGFGTLCVGCDTAMMILMPLALCIPHLVEIGGAFMEMWREPGSTWKAKNDLTRDGLAALNLSIGPAGLEKKYASKGLVDH